MQIGNGKWLVTGACGRWKKNKDQEGDTGNKLCQFEDVNIQSMAAHGD